MDSNCRYAQQRASLPTDLAGDRGLRPGQAAALLGICQATLYEYVKSGKLPKPQRISHRVSLFRASDVQALLSAQPEGGAAA